MKRFTPEHVGTATYKCFARLVLLLMMIVLSLMLSACDELSTSGAEYVWIVFSEDLVCRDRLTDHVQCFRVRLALRMKGEEFEDMHSEDRSLPPVLRESIFLRIESSGMIPVDFDDVARVDSLRKELSDGVASIVDSPRVEVSLRSCGERVEDMTEEELGRMFDEMDEEAKRKLMEISPILGYVDDE